VTAWEAALILLYGAYFHTVSWLTSLSFIMKLGRLTLSLPQAILTSRTGRAKKSNPLGKIRYLWNCSNFFHQIYSVYRGGFKPHILQISLQYFVETRASYSLIATGNLNVTYIGWCPFRYNSSIKAGSCTSVIHSVVPWTTFFREMLSYSGTPANATSLTASTQDHRRKR